MRKTILIILSILTFSLFIKKYPVIIINKFSIYKCIYYIGFIICSIMGSIFGINTKKGD